MEDPRFLMILPVQLIVIVALLASTRYRFSSWEADHIYHHLYVTGFFLLIRSALTAIEAGRPHELSIVTASYMARADLDQGITFAAFRLSYCTGELILSAGLYSTCYTCSVDQHSWSWSFATAVAAAWAFVTSLLHGPLALDFDVDQSPIETRFAFDTLAWFAYTGFAVGTFFVQRILRPAPTVAAPPITTTWIFSSQPLRAVLLSFGLIGPTMWLQYVKSIHASDRILLKHLQNNMNLFMLATACVTIWTASYLTLVSMPSLPKLARTILAWLLLLLATYLPRLCPWESLFDKGVFLIYYIVAMTGIAKATIATNVPDTHRPEAADVKMEVDSFAT